MGCKVQFRISFRNPIHSWLPFSRKKFNEILLFGEMIPARIAGVVHAVRLFLAISWYNPLVWSV